jgi:hypothetical protein
MLRLLAFCCTPHTRDLDCWFCVIGLTKNDENASTRRPHPDGSHTDVMAPYETQDEAERVQLEKRYTPTEDLRSAFDHRAFTKAASGPRLALEGDSGSELSGFVTNHSDTRIAPDDVPFFSGWLWKLYQGDGGGVRWKKRWFYLEDDRLCYTRTGNGDDKTSVVKFIPLDRIARCARSGRQRNPRRRVGIARVRPESVPPGLSLAGAGVGNHRCFIVQCGQVTHVLAAETDELAGRWIINWRKSTKPGYGACPPAREG